MNIQIISKIRKAAPSDAADLAKLIDIAGEGIPSWLWRQNNSLSQNPLDIGEERARRTSGCFSFANAHVFEHSTSVLGMVLSYPIDEVAEANPDDLPDPVAPFIELEKHSVGTWYVNALAVFAGHRGCGLGTQLLSAAEGKATASGYSRMSIQVYAQNTGAVRLYEQRGYEVTARSKVRLHPCQPYYTGDVLLMLKTLTY